MDEMCDGGEQEDRDRVLDDRRATADKQRFMQESEARRNQLNKELAALREERHRMNARYDTHEEALAAQLEALNRFLPGEDSGAAIAGT